MSALNGIFSPQDQLRESFGVNVGSDEQVQPPVRNKLVFSERLPLFVPMFKMLSSCVELAKDNLGPFVTAIDEDIEELANGVSLHLAYHWANDTPADIRIPHIFHIVCRSYLILKLTYADLLNRKNTVSISEYSKTEEIIKKLYPNAPTTEGIHLDLIHPCVYLSINKLNLFPGYTQASPSSWYNCITHANYRLMQEMKLTGQDPVKTVLPADLLFWSVAMWAHSSRMDD